MARTFGSTSARLRGYKAGTVLTASAPTAPSAPVLGAITVPSGTIKRVAITTFPADANYLTREVSINGGAYVSAGATLAIGATYFDYDVGSATSWSFRSKAGNSGGESSYSSVVSGTSTIVTTRSSLAYFLNADSLTTGAAAPAQFWANSATVSTDQAYSGTKSIKVPIVAGVNGNGWGTYLTDLIAGYNPVKGDTVWMSQRIWVPSSGVSWDGGGGEHAIKWMRFRMGTSGSGTSENAGTIYTKLNQDGSLKINREGFADPLPSYETVSTAGTGSPNGGTWTTLEHAVVFDNVSVDDGGLGEQRYYKDGVQVFRNTSKPTLINATDRVLTVAWIDYWNNTPALSFNAYIDDFCIAYKVAGHRDDTSVMATDANGRKFIGL